MCTSFVFRNKNLLIGMNFDNNGRDYKISDIQGKGFLIKVKNGNSFFPSIGISPNGIFVNDQMVDQGETGEYKRQNNRRWVPTRLIETILNSDISFSEIASILKSIEIVNGPELSTHNLIVDRNGDICVVEPGKSIIYSEKEESDIFILTNFPISDYKEIIPKSVAGSGSDRYLKCMNLLEKEGDQMSIESGFKVLESLQQNSSSWVTELSLIYDVTNQDLYYCQNRNFNDVMKIKLKLNG